VVEVREMVRSSQSAEEGNTASLAMRKVKSAWMGHVGGHKVRPVGDKFVL